MKTVKHRRAWLQTGNPDCLSYVSWNVGKYDVSVTLADCYKAVTIYVHNKKDIKKIDKLIKELTDFRDCIEENKDEAF